MHYLQRWRLMKGTRFCWTRHLRRLRHAILISALILISAFAGSILSNPQLVQLQAEVAVLQAQNKEYEMLLNGSVRMKDENTGEIETCKKEKVELIRE